MDPLVQGDVLLNAVDFHCSTITDDPLEVPSPPIPLHMGPAAAIRTAANLKRLRSADCWEVLPPTIRLLTLAVTIGDVSTSAYVRTRFEMTSI